MWLVNGGGGGPWHKEVVFLLGWQRRGESALASCDRRVGDPAQPLLGASQVHQWDSGGKRELEIN